MNNPSTPFTHPETAPMVYACFRNIGLGDVFYHPVSSNARYQKSAQTEALPHNQPALDATGARPLVFQGHVRVMAERAVGR